jgi:UDP-glucuronate 4-epimerase
VAESFLVTGSLGCIGSWVVRRLVHEGVPVVVYDAGDDLHRLNLLLTPEELAGVTRVVGDITDLGQLEKALDDNGVTNVIHLAALQIPFCRANPPLGASVNVVGTVNILEAVKRRLERMAPVVFAGSLATFDTVDVDPATGRLPANAAPHPKTHYGVYKLANEGNARVYWLEHQVPSASLRPMTVYGPGRDQGMTSSPTKALMAAVLGRGFDIPFGGATLYNYAEDVARSFISASRASFTGSHVVNLPGLTVDMGDLVAAIESVMPEAKGRITFAGSALPFPEAIEDAPPSVQFEMPVSPLDDCLRATIDIFKAAMADGRLIPAQHGLPD